jgi:hypothetical protein
VPCIEIVKFPVVAFAEAPKTTGVLEPAATLKGLTGFEVTPEGSVLSVTWTAPVKPFGVHGDIDGGTGGTLGYGNGIRRQSESEICHRWRRRKS